MLAQEEKLVAEYFNLVLPDDSHRAFNSLYCDNLRRTKLHEQLCEVFDVDRELIENLVEKVRADNYRPDPIGLDFNKAYDEFYNGMEYLKSLPAEKRHHISVFKEDEFKGLEPVPELGYEALSKEEMNAVIDEIVRSPDDLAVEGIEVD